ncbi:MAG: SUF system Fe-S cluster assembly regulator [Wenzhouxiangellaceae bacterium]
MLRIAKLTDYATVIMAELARQASACRSASLIAEQTGLEPPTVAKVLKLLARAGLVESVRGANGGYRLDRPAGSITVASIVRAMEGPIGLTECSAEPGRCNHERDCALRGNWRSIGDLVEQVLEKLTLADLIEPEIPAIRLRLLSDGAQVPGVQSR